MFSLLIAAALVVPGSAPGTAEKTADGQSPPPAASSDVPAEQADEALTATQLRAAVSAALKRTAASMKTSPDEAAVELLPLYTQVREHPVMAKVDRDRYGGVIRLRLKRMSRAIQERLEEGAEEQVEASDASAAERDAAALAEEAGAPGGQAVRDNGQQLVELIEATIAPEHWDVNGGPGTIFYYAPLRVLVVRASGTAHQRIGGVVGGLRGM